MKIYEPRKEDKPSEDRKDKGIVVRLGYGVTNSDIMDSIKELSQTVGRYKGKYK